MKYLNGLGEPNPYELDTSSMLDAGNDGFSEADDGGGNFWSSVWGAAKTVDWGEVADFGLDVYESTQNNAGTNYVYGGGGAAPAPGGYYPPPESKTGLYIGGAILGVALIGGGIYMATKK